MPPLPTRIQELARRWRTRPLTEAEYQEIEAWYGQPVPESIFWDTADRSEEELRQRLLTGILRRVPVPTARPRLRPRRRVRLAAALAAGLALSSGLLWWRGEQQQARSPAALAVVRGQRGQVRKLVLPDSSLVWLKGNSELRYPRTFAAAERNVELRGEALFEITKNPRRPFQIRVGTYTARVLGTSFNIRQAADGRNFDLLVLTGRVRVLADGLLGRATVREVAAHQAYSTAGAATAEVAPVQPLAPKAAAAAVAHTEYDMNFEQVPFREIMARIEQKFGVRLVGYAHQYDGCKLTADLTDQSLSTSLHLLTSALSARYTQQGTTITITGGGCF